MERPATVSIFGILNVLFGLFAFYGVIATQAMLFTADPENPVLKAMQKYPAYDIWAKTTIPLYIVSGIVLIVAGIGLLRQHEWARKLSIGYGIYAIPFTVVVSVMNYRYIFLPATGQGDAATPVAVAVAQTVALGIYALAFPVALIVFMMRKDVVASFRAEAEPPGLPN